MANSKWATARQLYALNRAGHLALLPTPGQPISYDQAFPTVGQILQARNDNEQESPVAEVYSA